MTSRSPHELSHWCSNCDTHFRLDQVRKYLPAPESALGEEEILQCATCGSYQVEELIEVTQPESDIDVRHWTVVFRVPGGRTALAEFLVDLAAKFPTSQHEVIAVRTGNALDNREPAK
jgi:hypothetical protein